MMLSLLGLACKSQQSGTMNGPEEVNVGTMPTDGQRISFETVKQARYCGIQQEQRMLVQSAEDWASLWKEIGSNQMPAPVLPEVDFSTQVLVTCFMGSRNTGGYVLEIQEVQTKGNTAYVSVKHTKPGPNCFVTEALTQPYHIVQLPKGSLNKAVFVVEEAIKTCGE